MTALVVFETVLLAALTVLVAGLLRAYGTVLRRLHELDGGRTSGGGARTFDLEPPAGRSEWSAGHDVVGRTVDGEVVSARVVGAEHDTVLLFLSSGCSSCAVFWDELARGVRLPEGTRLLVVAQDPDRDSVAALAGLAAPGLDLVLSSAAWRDYEVPGSPHVAYVDGPSGRVRGEGTGQSWGHVADLLARASGDPTFVIGARAAKPDRDAAVEARVDRELLAAGIVPGDARLYGPGAR